MIVHELGQERFRRAEEERVDEAAECTLLRGSLLHPGEVAVRPPFVLSTHEPLRLEIAQNGEHRGVGERSAKRVLDFCDSPRVSLPEHRHHFELAFARAEEILEQGLHETIDSLQLKLNLAGDAITNAFFVSSPVYST